MRMDQWNIVEGHGRVMTKGYEVSGECYLRRRAFNIKGNNGRQSVKGKKRFTVWCINKRL